MPVLEDVPYSELAPDWVCEVVSPSTGRSDRVLKMPVYAREQVGHLWLVDPRLRTLEVYRLEGAPLGCGEYPRREWHDTGRTLCGR